MQTACQDRWKTTKNKHNLCDASQAPWMFSLLLLYFADSQSERLREVTCSTMQDLEFAL